MFVRAEFVCANTYRSPHAAYPHETLGLLDYSERLSEAPPMASATANSGKAVRRAVFPEGDRSTDLWLLCQAGTHRFALPMASVIETMRMLPVEAVSGPPRFVCGLSIIRGAAVPVIDTARLFDDEAARYERLVTVRTCDRTVAFAASAVHGVRSIKSSECEALPPLLRDAQLIAALARSDEQLVFLLRAARALPEDFQVGDHALRENS
jgi:purine-binding chemotaxis protein CheW